jgi:hypothetical protein
LDINNSFFKSALLGLKEVFGLPKYFFKFFGLKKAVLLGANLLYYYFKIIARQKTIRTIRKKAIDGNVGK